MFNFNSPIMDTKEYSEIKISEVEPIFKGETFSDKVDEYYRLEESGSELYHLISSKIATYISYWYYSAGAVTDKDFEKLQEDIDKGEV